MKLFRGVGGVNAVSVLLLALTATSCYRPARAVVQAGPGEWLTRHGDVRHAPFADVDAPLTVQRVYSEGLGRGLPALPVIQEQAVIAVVSGGGVVTASAATGERFWSRRFNGSVAGQVLRIGDRIVFATQHRRGEVHALDMQRGRRAWRHRLDERPAAEPAYADGSLFIATERGRVIALDARTGREYWSTMIRGLIRHAPVVAGEDVLVATRDTLVLVHRGTGTERARYPVAGAPSAPLALRGDTVVIVTQAGTVAAYAGYGATELWQHDVANPILAAPAVTADGVFVLTRAAEVWRVTAQGTERVTALEGAATESFTVTRNGFLVGLLDGTMHFVDRNGTRVWVEDAGGSIRAPAAVHDGAVYVATINGRLVKLSP